MLERPALPFADPPGSTDPGTALDLNTATKAELMTLPKIKQVRADMILGFRAERGGRIDRLWDLHHVKGLGEELIRSLQPLLAPLADTMLDVSLRRSIAATLTVGALRPPLVAGHHLLVGTWNIQRLSLAKSDDALCIMAAVVAAMDVVAIQEVVDDRVLGKLLLALPEGWRCHMSPSIGEKRHAEAHHGYTERYAFLYRSDVVTLRWSAIVGRTSHLMRPPMLAVFSVVATGRVVAVVNFHAVYGKDKSQRQAEVRAVQGVAMTVADTMPGCPILLMGDFNVVAGDESWEWEAGRAMGWTPALPPTTFTTVKNRAWDHVWTLLPDGPREGDAGHPSVFVISASVYRYHERLAVARGVDAVALALSVSDHLPVHVTLGFQSGVDAEGTSVLLAAMEASAAGPDDRPCVPVRCVWCAWCVSLSFSCVPWCTEPVWRARCVVL